MFVLKPVYALATYEMYTMDGGEYFKCLVCAVTFL